MSTKGKEVSLVVAAFLDPRHLELETQDGPKVPFWNGKQVEVAPLELFCHGNRHNATLL